MNNISFHPLVSLDFGWLATVPIDAPAIPETDFWTSVFRAVVLGFVQGLAEFLPISSTGHLKVVPVVLGWGDPGVAYTAVMPLGCIAAVIWYFWSDLSQIAKGAVAAIARSDYQDHHFRLALGIGVGTLPIIGIGVLVKLLLPDFNHSPLRSLGAIAIASIGMSLVLALAEKLGQRQRSFESLMLKDAVLMGLSQCLAFIPGVSRSGATLTAGLMMGLERETAARFSFLLGIPSITLAGLVELQDALTIGLMGTGIIPLIVGILSTTFFSYLSIAWLLHYLKTHNTWIFVWYRLAFGVAILTAITTNFLKNV